MTLCAAVVLSCTKKDASDTDTFALAAPADSSEVDASHPVEGLPPELVAAINQQTVEVLGRAADKTDEKSDHAMRSVIIVSGRWKPGQVLNVAFLGGSAMLRDSVASAAAEWSQFANLKFNFWMDPAHSQFREWSPADKTYHEQIRISFDRPGYWSLVGSESLNPIFAGPGAASMNFQGFAAGLPDDWRSTVLHEFGHAIGLEHEHQNPAGPCESEFRWDDDPGYTPTRSRYGDFVRDGAGHRPGIYTVLGGPPNGWSKAGVDFNLRRLTDTSDLDVGVFDPSSIMKYYFASWMFRSGSASRCYSQPAADLSKGDKDIVREDYPQDLAAAPSRDSTIRKGLQNVELSGTERAKVFSDIKILAARQRTVNSAIAMAQAGKQ